VTDLDNKMKGTNKEIAAQQGKLTSTNELVSNAAWTLASQVVSACDNPAFCVCFSELVFAAAAGVTGTAGALPHKR
jgi:hypothetical protein